MTRIVSQTKKVAACSEQEMQTRLERPGLSRPYRVRRDMQSFRVGSANLLWFLYSAGMSRKWQRATPDVAGTQQAVLKRLLSNNADSEFGQEHHFAAIDSVEAYQQAVPIRSYE